MEAEIFCLSRDLAAASVLRELLTTHIDKSITLTVHNIEEGTALERAPMARRYTQLLQATIPPDSGISVSVTAMDWFMNRVYMGIYWPMSVAGSWAEVAGTSVFFESYTVWRSIHCQARPDHGSELFFPALALRDRMVLVPTGQDVLLTQAGLTPADVAGGLLPRDVLEVNFHDRNAVENAVTALSQRLVAETRREIMGYLAVHPGATIDVAALSAELGVGPALFARSMKEEASVYETLSFELTERRFVPGDWTRTSLLVRNNSATPIPRVRVKISGPADIEPREILIEIPPDTEVVHDVSVRAFDPGEFPLSITVLLPQGILTSAFADWQPPPTYLWLKSAREPDRPPQ
jgi:hypothetical protein